MRSQFSDILTLLVGLSPQGRLKNRIFEYLGHAVARDASIGICLIWGVRRIEMGAGSRIGSFNVLRDLTILRMGRNSSLGSWNWISAAPVFQGSGTYAGIFDLGEESAVTSRHYLDCSGGLVIGEFATVAGQRTTILSHSIDLKMNNQSADCVRIGSWTFVATGCTLLMSSVLPDRSVLAAGAVLTATRRAPVPGLWGGVPAKHIGEVSGNYFTRQTGYVDYS